MSGLVGKEGRQPVDDAEEKMVSQWAAQGKEERRVPQADRAAGRVVEGTDRVIIHPLDQRVNLRGQSRHAVGDAAVCFQCAHGCDADQRDLFGQVIGRKDGQVGRRREARAKVAKVGVEELGVIDQADQIMGGVAQWDMHKGAKGIVDGSWRGFDFARAIDLADVVSVGVGF